MLKHERLWKAADLIADYSNFTTAIIMSSPLHLDVATRNPFERNGRGKPHTPVEDPETLGKIAEAKSMLEAFHNEP